MAYDGENYKEEVKQMIGCQRCDLHLSRSNVVTYRGNPRSDVMVIGEAPGKREDEKGIPMVGLTGSYLVDVLAALSFPLMYYYITNVILCNPPKNGDPTIEQMNACSKWLNWQIDKVNPKWIIAVGRIAYSRVNPQFDPKIHRITKEAGTIVTPQHLNGIKVIPILHPSAILRMRSKKPDYEKKLESIIGTIKEDLELK